MSDLNNLVTKYNKILVQRKNNFLFRFITEKGSVFSFNYSYM